MELVYVLDACDIAHAIPAGDACTYRTLCGADVHLGEDYVDADDIEELCAECAVAE